MPSFLESPSFPEIPAPPRLTEPEKQFLGAVAWRAVERCLLAGAASVTETPPSLDDPWVRERVAALPPESSCLRDGVGVFVTLFSGPDLRGCLGNARASEPLWLALWRLAQAAAQRDPRFPPIEADELDVLSLEVTCLGAMTPVAASLPTLLQELQPDQHGVWLSCGRQRGILLPQVARRNGWDARELLEQVSLKAGLGRTAWQSEGARLELFTSASFDPPRSARLSPAVDRQASRPAVAAGSREGLPGRLRQAGLAPRRPLGQHFLHDPRLLEALVRDAPVSPQDRVFEVGTGPGTLTRELARVAARVVTVEVDPDMCRFAREELSAFDNITFLCADVLEGRGLHPDVLQAARDLEPFVWVSNLPYNIATHLILHMCEARLVWSHALVMVQAEVAARLVASAGDPAYGPSTALLSFWVRERRGGRKVPAGAFWPPPRVDSRMIWLGRPEPLGEPEEYRAYSAWVRCLLGARRKQLQRLLRDALGPARSLDALARGGWDPRLRPERLAPEDFLLLAREFPLSSA